MESSPSLPLIYDLSAPDLSLAFSELNLPAYRVGQIWKGIYQNGWASPEEFSNLPITMRNILTAKFSFQSCTPIRSIRSKDKETTKVLFSLPDQRKIETVWMQYTERDTLCVSTQSGCAMGCTFCATGQMGFFRNLSAGEIVEQVVYFNRILALKQKRVKNIVFMGMGEPFQNYHNLLKAIEILNDPDGLNLGARRMTVSTVGIVPRILDFANLKSQVNLAVSLHTVDDELRSKMMPVNKKYPVDQLLDACRQYIDLTHRRITFEWALIEGVNDTPESAYELARKLHGMLCHVNAIQLNPTANYSGKATNRERAEKFKDTLEKAGIPCTIRLRRGIDIQAGCGQLASSTSD